MRITCHRNFLIWATLFQSLLFVFMLVNKTYAATETKLLPYDGAASDWFGYAVSVSGDVALVGALGDSDKGDESGSAYVFRWNGSNWVQEQKLVASDGAAKDYFGTSVSISGDVALVGADWDDDKGSNSGSAYVFRWNGSNWVQEQKLLASDGVSGDWFGGSVSIDGNVALVGAQGNDDNEYNSGSAYVFRWNGSNWVEEQELLPSDGAAFDFCGESVSVDGNVALVGAVEDDDKGDDSGSAYVFRWNGSSWVQEQKLLPSDGAAYDWFGESVSVDGNVALVGAVEDDDKGDESGSAYVFRWNGSNWVEEQKLLPSDGAAYDWFGGSVSISGNAALVGAVGDYGASGSAYVFSWNGSNWVEEQKLVASDGYYYDYFGTSVSISSNVALVGADSNDDKGNQSGSAYVYTLEVQSELIADFSAIPTSGPAPLIVSFSDQSMGTVSSWSWDFGDSSTSTEQNPTHTYTAAGTYTVSLTVTGPQGTDTETKTDFIVARDASFSTAAAYAVLANMYSDSAMANAVNALDDPSYYSYAALYASSAYELAEDAYEDATAALAAAASYSFWGYYAPVYAESDINVRDDAVDSINLAAQYAALGDLDTAEYYLGYGLSLAATADFYNGPTIWCAAMESSGQAAAQQSSASSELEPSANGTSTFSSAATNAVLSNMYFATSVTYGVSALDDPSNIPLVQLYASTAYDYAEDAYNAASAALDGNSSFWGVYAAQYAESDMNNKADALSAFDQAVLAYQSGDLETAGYYLGYGFSLAALADLYNATTIWCASMESDGATK